MSPSVPGCGEFSVLPAAADHEVLQLLSLPLPCRRSGRLPKISGISKHHSLQPEQLSVVMRDDYCIVLHCIVLYFILLHCIALYCFVLYCIALHCIVLYCIALYCIVLHVLYCIALHCIALYCIVLHCISLYCFVL